MKTDSICALTATIQNANDDVFLHDFYRLVKEFSLFLLFLRLENSRFREKLVVTQVVRLVCVTTHSEEGIHKDCVHM